MNWTTAILQEAEHLYRSRESQEVAEVLSERYGTKVTACTVRSALMRNGVADSKRMPSDIAKAHRLIRKFRSWGWSVYDIAEQLSTWAYWVKSACRAMEWEWVQLDLWPSDQFKVPAPPLRIVHRSTASRSRPCVQLELFPELNHQRIAA